jgi:hypothetical protein
MRDAVKLASALCRMKTRANPACFKIEEAANPLLVTTGIPIVAANLTLNNVIEQ